MDDRELLVLEGPPDDRDGEDGGTDNLPLPGDKSCLNLVYLAALVAAIGGLLFGYDVGIITGAKLQVAHDLGLTCAQEELLVALMPLGALSASLVADPCLSGIGRKATIQLTAFVFTLGALLMAFSHSLLQLLFGRFTVGFAVSLSAMAECLYISEISAPSNRGLLISLNELGITLGLLLAYIVNFIFMSVDRGWRYMFGLSTILSVVQLGALFLLPRTPHFLVMKKRESEASAVLQRMGNGVGVRQQLANIRASMLEVEESSCSALFGSQNNMRGRLFIGLGLVLLQQLTGQPNILYYATDVFEAVGFCGSTLASLATVGLGTVKVGATVVSLCLVDRLGRRTLLMGGVILMATSLAALTVFAGYQAHVVGGLQHKETCAHTNTSSTHSSPFLDHLNSSSLTMCEDNPLPPALRYIAFAAIVTFVAAYSLSFGPISWIILSEIFPLGSKGRAMSLGQAVNWTANVFVSVTFLDAVSIFSLPVVFCFYLVMSILSVGFIYTYVPETRNKTLEEISRDLKKGKKQKWAFKFPRIRFIKGSRGEQQTPRQFVRLEEEETNWTRT